MPHSSTFVIPSALFVIPSILFVIPSAAEEPPRIPLQRYKPLRSSLKMVMVWGGSAALGAIVEECEIRIFSCQIEHVHISFPYGLVCMSCSRNHQMVRKDRVRIQKYMVFLALPALELEHYLFLRTVFAAKEALPFSYIGLRQLCSR